MQVADDERDEDRATGLDERVGQTHVGQAINAAVEAILARQDPDLAAYPDEVRDAEIRARDEARRNADRDARRLVVAGELRTAGGFQVRAIEAAIAPADTAAMRGARKWRATSRTALVLAGGVGAGKSTAAAWLALERGTDVRELADAIGAGSAAGTNVGLPARISASELEARGRYDKELRGWLRGRSMLVIDDLGVELLDDKGVFRSLLDETLDQFYGDRRRIVITTNLRIERSKDSEPPQFLERYGDRVASRLYEIGHWWHCGASDLRRGITPITRSR